jgi:hypothetical protein
MKITPDHIKYIKAAICATPAPTLASYTARGLTEKRWRWDQLYAAKLSTWICDNIYPYANDDHLDTALKHILKGA